ncbi:MAG TPA: protease modulator HflK [Verrucomicrobiae bacterium]|jgi:membrane protease subunit HflK
MSEHEHSHHGHEHQHTAPEAQDAGTQALSEALRSSFFIVKVVMLLMVVAFICSGFFTVGASERAVILRFGKLVGEGDKALLGPGWHWSFPFPIDEIVRIPISAQQKVESTVGWYFTTQEQELSGEPSMAGGTLNPAIDGYLITADHDIVHSRATLYYHVSDPIAYTFDFSNAELTVQNALNNALLHAAASFTADDILLNRQTEFREAVQTRVTDLADQEHLGIQVDSCEISSVPPRQLAGTFTEVTDTREKSASAISGAQSYATNKWLNAEARATALTNRAAVDSANYVSFVQADAKRFNDLLPQYRTNAALFAQLQVNQVMAEALTNAGDKWFIPRQTGGKPDELRLQLNPEPPEPNAAPPGQ